MKRNLIIGIVLIGAAALSSCSSTKLASLRSSAFDDDVYYTSAKAGDSQDFVADNQMSYNADDDYYYYGDYASRLNRFSSYSPFSYNDNFYYSYVPYNNGFGAGTDYDRDYFANYYGFGSQLANNGMLNNYIYSPYDYGYDPYDFGYDDLDYGDIYSAFLFDGGFYGGGGGGYTYYGTGHASWKNHSSNPIVAGNNPNARGARTGGSPGITRISSLPGRPVLSVNPANGTVTRLSTNSLNNTVNNNQNNNVTRQSRDNSYRPQTQSFNSSPSVSSGSSGGSAGAGGGGGGGGRPSRP